MNLDTLISSNAVICNHEIRSKKRALEILAEQLATEASKSSPAQAKDSPQTLEAKALEIFQLLTEREKLGSTCLSHGVALPHARTNLTDQAIGAFLKLDKGINFDSPDDLKTDLIFALMVPEHYTDAHLKILAHLASIFNDKTFCKKIRNTNDNIKIYTQLIERQITP